MKPVESTLVDPERLSGQRSLVPVWVGVGVLALASAIGIGVVTDEKPAAEVAASGTTSTTSQNAVGAGVSIPDAPATTVVGATPGTAGGGPAPAAPAPTTAAPRSDDLGPAQDPGPTVTARPGRYDYQRSAGDRTNTATTEIVDQGGGKQEHRFVGQQNEFTNSVVWTDGALTITRSRYTLRSEKGEATGECDWNPDIREYVFPLAAGAKWTVDTTCTMTVDGRPVTIARKGTAEVTGLERIKVAGNVVDTWAIKRTESSDTRFAQGSLEADTVSTEWFSPKHGLKVRTRGTTKAKTTFGDRTRENEAKVSEELLNFEPK